MGKISERNSVVHALEPFLLLEMVGDIGCSKPLCITPDDMTRKTNRTEAML